MPLHGFNTRFDTAVKGRPQMFVPGERGQILDGRDDHRVLQKLGVVDRPGARVRPLNRNLNHRDDKTMFPAAVSEANLHDAILPTNVQLSGYFIIIPRYCMVSCVSIVVLLSRILTVRQGVLFDNEKASSRSKN
jgi:hypothetical protein